MKTVYLVVIVLALLFIPGCAQKVNDPSDAQAIRDLGAEYDKAFSSQDTAWIKSSFFTDDAITLPPNAPLVSGGEAIAASYRSSFDPYSSTQLSTPSEEIFSSGDTAVARGGYTWKGTPKASGLGAPSEQGKWMGTFRRQSDGSWKCDRLIWNRDEPAPGATADGADEQALLQIERDWTEAMLKKDRAAMEKIMADDFVGNDPDGVQNKRQALASMMSSAFKIESIEIHNMQAMVFGDNAVVYGVSTGKGTVGGRDISGQSHRWIDTFEKRDGRWLCVGGYGRSAEE